MMAQHCRLDVHRCVPVVGVARVEARGLLICLRGTGRRVRIATYGSSPACAPNMTVCPAS